MGQLVDGAWSNAEAAAPTLKGAFARPQAVFNGRVEPGGRFPPQAGRYHLYVSLACPWAHRTLIFRHLKGLDTKIGLSVTHWLMGDEGWTFAQGEGVVPDPFGAHALHEIYTRADPHYTGRVSVPVLWDTVEKTIVTSAGDPSFKIGKIASANNTPVSVKPNATLEEAVTLMLARNFSQLPVMTTDREVKGVVSWRSIGARLATKTTGADVQTYMDDHQEIIISASLFSGIRIIVEYGYVLVRSPDRKISGIVTASDIALEFEEISTPFLLLAEIENNLRSLISKKLTMADIRRACSEEHLPKEFSAVSELTFGNYVRILEHADNWGKLGFYLDRIAFCSELSRINTIRNDVMHFDPDPLSEQDLSQLRNVAKMFDLLRSLGGF